MSKNKGVRDYQSMQILSAKPEKLILMLYDGAIRFLQLSIKGMENNNIEQAHNNIIKTQNILIELMASLNFKAGGELAINLFRIYEFMHYTLVQANVKKNPEPVRRILSQIKKLRNSWAQALKMQNAAASSNRNQNETNAEENQNKKSIELTG